MIFLTVGTQLPFPRLIDAMDALAAGLDEKVVAQTGPFDGAIRHMEATQNLVPADFEAHFTAARLVVAHAGIGSVLSAKRFGKPLVVVPRRVEFGEHRNDHQLATAKEIERIDGIYVAWQTADLAPLLARQDLVPASEKMTPSRDALLTRLRGFIEATG